MSFQLKTQIQAVKQEIKAKQVLLKELIQLSNPPPEEEPAPKVKKFRCEGKNYDIEKELEKLVDDIMDSSIEDALKKEYIEFGKDYFTDVLNDDFVDEDTDDEMETHLKELE